ncbi:MAG TPA: hypothetical protein PK640_20100 [Verrucomicrobiota bacterium]|nr:hypothetical protein [Verrucomicrobiota bacterium]
MTVSRHELDQGTKGPKAVGAREVPCQATLDGQLFEEHVRRGVRAGGKAQPALEIVRRHQAREIAFQIIGEQAPQARGDRGNGWIKEADVKGLVRQRRAVSQRLTNDPADACRRRGWLFGVHSH